MNTMPKKHPVTCPSCKETRYVSYTQRSAVRRGLKGGHCRPCYRAIEIPVIPIAIRLERNTKQLENGCIVWTGGLMPNGYARIGKGRADEGAAYIHRVAYELKYGKIPEGLEIDHLCRNRSCANIEHLEAVTPVENALRAIKVREENRKRRKEMVA